MKKALVLVVLVLAVLAGILAKENEMLRNDWENQERTIEVYESVIDGLRD